MSESENAEIDGEKVRGNELTSPMMLTRPGARAIFWGAIPYCLVKAAVRFAQRPTWAGSDALVYTDSSVSRKGMGEKGTTGRAELAAEQARDSRKGSYLFVCWTGS